MHGNFLFPECLEKMMLREGFKNVSRGVMVFWAGGDGGDGGGDGGDGGGNGGGGGGGGGVDGVDGVDGI